MSERQKITIRTLFSKAEKGEPISWLTCYDYPTAYFQDQAEREGLIIRAIGDIIAVCPPLIITDAEIDELLGCLECALDATLAWVDQ